MTSGDNNAKQIVVDEADRLADKLQNGNAGCVETQGRAIALLVKMIKPLYMAQFVTVHECKRLHGGDGQKPQKNKNVKSSRIKVGPVEIEGPIVNIVLSNIAPIMCCCVSIFVVGVIKGWW